MIDGKLGDGQRQCLGLFSGLKWAWPWRGRGVGVGVGVAWAWPWWSEWQARIGALVLNPGEHVNIKAHPKLNPNLNPKRLGFRVRV